MPSNPHESAPSVPAQGSTSPTTEGEEQGQEALEEVTALLQALASAVSDRPACSDQEVEAAQALTQAIKTALDDLLEFRYFDSPHPVLGAPVHFFRFLVAGQQTGNYQVRMEAHPSHFCLLYTSPLNIPAVKRVLVAEYVCRVNYCLLLGCFEIDMRDGEVQYKIVQRNEGMNWNPQVVASLYVTAARMMDQFWPGIMALTYTDQSPEAAFQNCRNTSAAAAATAPSPGGGNGDQTTTQKPPSCLEQ
jgi:hypothetical protein